MKGGKIYTVSNDDSSELAGKIRGQRQLWSNPPEEKGQLQATQPHPRENLSLVGLVLLYTHLKIHKLRINSRLADNKYLKRSETKQIIN